MSISLLFNSLSVQPLTCKADACRVVTLGADLSDEQRAKMFEFFNVKDSEVMVIEITNEDERKYLEGIVEDSIIGTHTYSCAYINPDTKDGVQVKTANLNWVTAEMLGNSLITAGVTNVQVIATAPFEVSGTGALTGVLAAYEAATEETLDTDKKTLATEELVISSDISSNAEIDVSEDESTESIINNFITDVKTDIINTDDSVEDIIKRNALKYGIELTEEQITKLQDWGTKLSDLDYGEEMIKALDTLSENIAELSGNLKVKVSDAVSNVDTEEVKNWFQKIWEAIVNFFKNLFGSGEDGEGDSSSNSEVTEENIFENANQDVFQFDDMESETIDETLNSDVIVDEFNVSEEQPIENNEENTEQPLIQETLTPEEQIDAVEGAINEQEPQINEPSVEGDVQDNNDNVIEDVDTITSENLDAEIYNAVE